MGARKVIIGCSAVALVILAFLVIGGIVAFKRLTAPAPLPPVARLSDSESLGLAVARFEPDDPWVVGTIEQLSKYSTRDKKPEEIFPLEVVWTERRDPGGHEQHILSLSLSRGGRFAGLVGDLMLWRAGRSKSAKISRVEYGGEGITSFPGTSIHGHLFIRDNNFIWSSDLDTAKKAVDMFSDINEVDPDGPAGAGELPKVFALVPQGEAHTIAGAIINENGSLARSLALMPGESLDLPVEMLAPVESLIFTMDSKSANEGTGEMTLAFVPGTPPGVIASVAKEICRGLALVPLAEVTIEAVPRLEESRAVLALKIGGLDSVAAPALAMFAHSVKQVEAINSGSRWKFGEDEPKVTPPDGAAKDPNQSSSTFQ